MPLINAFAGLGRRGGFRCEAGDGVKVGIVDTGIDVTHPCFNDAGFPATPKQGPPSLTNNKVIVAKVFNNKAPSRNHTPAAVQAHGTHVAGTVACDYGLANGTTTVDGVSVATESSASRLGRSSGTTTSSRMMSRTRAARTS